MYVRTGTMKCKHLLVLALANAINIFNCVNHDWKVLAVFCAIAMIYAVYNFVKLNWPDEQ